MRIKTNAAIRQAGQAVRWFVEDESGVAAIEYGLLATLVAIAAIAGFKALGDSLRTLWGYVADEVSKVL